MSEVIDAQARAVVWRQHVETWKVSGQSQKAFCLTHELPYHRFVYWRQQFEGSARRRERGRTSGGFAKVVHEASRDAGLTLSLPNGLVVRGICAANVTVVRQLLDQFR